MAKAEVYTPTNYIETTRPQPVIFLAGPIQGAEDWQATAIKLIEKENPFIIVANPRRQSLPGEFDYDAQTDWETFHLKRAGQNGTIMFWLAKETEHIIGRSFAQTSRVEFGRWLTRHEYDKNVNLVVGIERGFSGAKYFRRELKPFLEIPVLDALEPTCLAAVSTLDRSIIDNPLPRKIR